MSFEDNIEAQETASPVVSLIMVADGNGAGLVELVESYLSVLNKYKRSYEFVLLYDSADPDMRLTIEQLNSMTNVLAIAPRPWGNLDEALADGIRRAKGDAIVTLPGWAELDPSQIVLLLEALDDADMVTGQRSQKLPATQHPRVAMAHGLVRMLFGQQLSDIFCRTRSGSRKMFQQVIDIGVRQHFLSLVAISEGYRVREIPVKEAEKPVTPALHKLNPWSHVTALVDMLSLYIVLKFLKRPLRFFGAIGVPMIFVGALLTFWVVIDRLVLGTPLADRPALVFSVMTLVLGIQIVALGLVSEIIIFASSRRMRGYEIEKILRGRPSE
ncbi:MAG: glycosyl transferase family 2 [Pseudomonadota bacterium]